MSDTVMGKLNELGNILDINVKSKETVYGKLNSLLTYEPSGGGGGGGGGGSSTAFGIGGKLNNAFGYQLGQKLTYYQPCNKSYSGQAIATYGPTLIRICNRKLTYSGTGSGWYITAIFDNQTGDKIWDSDTESGYNIMTNTDYDLNLTNSYIVSPYLYFGTGITIIVVNDYAYVPSASGTTATITQPIAIEVVTDLFDKDACKSYFCNATEKTRLKQGWATTENGTIPDIDGDTVYSIALPQGATPVTLNIDGSNTYTFGDGFSSNVPFYYLPWSYLNEYSSPFFKPESEFQYNATGLPTSSIYTIYNYWANI